MPRRLRPLVHLLLCLMVAVLPMRALAHGWVMLAPAPVQTDGQANLQGHAQGGSQAHTEAQAQPHAPLPDGQPLAPATVHPAPCHGLAAATSADRAADGAADATADVPGNSAAPQHSAAPDTPHSCAACELCHAGLVLGAQRGWLSQPQPGTAPRAAHTPCIAGSPGDGIFRPPRG